MSARPLPIPVLPEQLGIPCPKCYDTHFRAPGRRVTDKQRIKLAVRRIHRCPKCGHRFRTIERLE
jgi:transcriptional regulator NrdR family protein